jgi:hypothetical protein
MDLTGGELQGAMPGGDELQIEDQLSGAGTPTGGERSTPAASNGGPRDSAQCVPPSAGSGNEGNGTGGSGEETHPGNTGPGDSAEGGPSIAGSGNEGLGAGGSGEETHQANAGPGNSAESGPSSAGSANEGNEAGGFGEQTKRGSAGPEYSAAAVGIRKGAVSRETTPHRSATPKAPETLLEQLRSGLPLPKIISKYSSK